MYGKNWICRNWKRILIEYHLLLVATRWYTISVIATTTRKILTARTMIQMTRVRIILPHRKKFADMPMFFRTDLSPRKDRNQRAPIMQFVEDGRYIKRRAHKHNDPIRSSSQIDPPIESKSELLVRRYRCNYYERMPRPVLLLLVSASNMYYTEGSRCIVNKCSQFGAAFTTMTKRPWSIRLADGDRLYGAWECAFDP